MRMELTYRKYMTHAICALTAALMVLPAAPASAWGPHTQITQAALDVLDANDPLARHLVDSFDQLATYCWMPDYDRSIRKDTDGSLYYADDYLLFPEIQKHAAHAMPGVRSALEPFFRRSVQALRHETPVNAARWIGSLLHYTEDSGAPPHARPGVADHGKMENWVDGESIGIAGYEPRLLGKTEDEALAGYLKRMDGLIAYSVERAEKMAPFVKADNRPAVEPIALECANECSRVAADLLYTLGRIALSPTPDAAVFRGTTLTKADAPADGRTAKIMMDGSNLSTLAEADGKFALHNLTPGTYMGRILTPGCRMNRFTLRLEPGETRNLNIMMVTLKPAGNLLRNPDLRIEWKTPGAPDCWLKTAAGWESDVVPVTAGDKYQLTIRWKKGGKGSAAVRWHTNLSPGLARSQSEAPVTQDRKDTVFAAPEGTASACIVVKTEGEITDAIETIVFAPVK